MNEGKGVQERISPTVSNLKTDKLKGCIFDIQRFSIQDGPGIRTTVFFKGCPLSCLWCSNPESQLNSPQLLFFQHLCTRCYKCVSVCPNQANRVLEDGSVELDRSLCSTCGKCVDACFAKARHISGTLMTVDEVLEIVEKDTIFYRNSGGGMTASGGEATSQPDFLTALFTEAHNHGFHTTLDTCGYTQWPVLERVLEHTDLVLFDIKHLDSIFHKKLTGVSNDLILENAKKIGRKKVQLILRVPLIPGYNDSEENIEGIGKLAVELKSVEVNLLPYHRLGISKTQALGREYKLKHVPLLKDEDVKKIADTIRSCGVPVKII